MSLSIEIYGRDDCRFCAAARAHCSRRGYPFIYHDMTGSDAMLAALEARLGEPVETVPQIFIGSHHIGGFTDLQDQDDSVRQLLKA